MTPPVTHSRTEISLEKSGKSCAVTGFVLCHFMNGVMNGVKSLCLGFLCQLNHLAAFIHAHAQGLFAEDMLAVFAGRTDVCQVAWRRRGYAHGVDAAFKERLFIRESQGKAMLLLHLAQTLWIGFKNRVQF